MHHGDAPGRGSFARPLALAGWSARSAWGYDAVFECYWVELWPAAAGGVVRIGPERLIVTLGGLARVVAGAVDVPADDAYLALTA
ncbi:hypothetical protein [Actinotalea sp.]|uniref:hypothetical protein n=1 Tax=Actinotalea sp. TaxID=1872145 RepID=UPI002BC77067|nr:hypothetical protein [Actinotalea sp.]HQY32978.1 hypothetical protein [Actinotalea sp.]HRA51324.1 hypothetical protein [Actinotalea sp.]